MGHDPCRISDKKKAQSEKIAPLKLRNQMSGAFVFLSIGFGLGVLAFIGELIGAKIKKKSRVISGSVTVIN
jgi:Na+-driven multidrug efflux pump